MLRRAAEAPIQDCVSKKEQDVRGKPSLSNKWEKVAGWKTSQCFAGKLGRAYPASSLSGRNIQVSPSRAFLQCSRQYLGPHHLLGILDTPRNSKSWITFSLRDCRCRNLSSPNSPIESPINANIARMLRELVTHLTRYWNTLFSCSFAHSLCSPRRSPRCRELMPLSTELSSSLQQCLSLGSNTASGSYHLDLSTSWKKFCGRLLSNPKFYNSSHAVCT